MNAEVIDLASLDIGPVFRPAAKLITEPCGDYIIEDLFRAGDLSVLVGEAGAGKSFLALNMAGAIADGRSWFGREVKRGSVAIASFEGDAFSLRLQALQGQGFSLDDVYVLRMSEPLSPRVERDGTERASMGEIRLAGCLAGQAKDLELARKPPIVLLVIDTIRASLTGSEDHSESVAAYLRAIRRILSEVPTAGALLLHHAGWMDGETKRKRERGSSAFRGNCDSTVYLEVEREDEETGAVYLSLTTLKVRDAERPRPLRLIRQRVDVLGQDRFGNPLSSCIVVQDGRTRADLQAEEAAHQTQADLAVLRAMDSGASTQRDLRVLVSLRMELVSRAIARIKANGRAKQGKQGEPYLISTKGRAVIEQGSGS